MSPLAALTARQLAEVARETQSLARPAVMRAAVGAATLVLAVTGAGFLLAAAHVALARSLGAEAAGLIVGFALLTGAGALALWARWRRPADPPAAPSPEQPAAAIGKGDLASLAAFTAAFVLARRLSRKRTR